ncbi:MAG: lipid-A-disaccharide synthase [Thiotrichaceae bacterium]|nr:lipid-A-disaccharide synthase [Thiotrichaceae bacterium]
MRKRIAIIAGEASGDILGSRLMIALHALNPEIQFEGIGGEGMIAEGFNSLFPMERLSVMGFTEVIGRLPELLSIRRQLLKRWKHNPPDLLIGIDAPDFNLKLEAKLHDVGVKVAHYVSPSVWAWRSSRVKKMQGKLDLMLCLFPFEASFYQKHQIPVHYVGHPLADEISLQNSVLEARAKLSLDKNAKVLAILPGSRGSELKYLAEDFILTAQRLQASSPKLILIAPMATVKLKQIFQDQLNKLAPDLVISLVNQQSREVMAAADVVLMASGTAVLEGMLLAKPMVAAGRLSSLTAWIIRVTGMLNVKYYTLPNNLADEALVTELIQEEVTVNNLVRAVENCFALSLDERHQLEEKYTQIHQQLRKDASKVAAHALVQSFDLGVRV